MGKGGGGDNKDILLTCVGHSYLGFVSEDWCNYHGEVSFFLVGYLWLGALIFTPQGVGYHFRKNGFNISRKRGRISPAELFR